MPKIEFNGIASFIENLKSRSTKIVSPHSDAYTELQGLIDDLCALYLGVPAPQRAEIRKLVAEPPLTLDFQLENHTRWAAEQIWLTKDVEFLRRGLAAASIQDRRVDYRDLFIRLGNLYLAASCVGIDCSTHFRDVAELSSAEQSAPMFASMGDFLANFEKSAYFEQAVRTRIGLYESPRIQAEILNILADTWDPLETKRGKYPRNEYQSYIHDIYELLVNYATIGQMTEHLSWVARRRMEREPPPTTAEAVIALRAIKLTESSS